MVNCLLEFVVVIIQVSWFGRILVFAIVWVLMMDFLIVVVCF